MEGKCWISADTCIVSSDGIPYCRMLRGSASDERFVRVGFLTESGRDPRPLYGRRTDRASADWRYFMSDGDNNNMQYPVIIKDRNCMTHNRGCPEINEGQQVYVQGFKERGFTASIS